MQLIKKIPVWLILLIPPMLLILPGLGNFHYAVGAEFNDIEISHYPNLLFVQQTILKYGEIPLWNPYILGGYPFDADPLSGLWYPANWLILFFPVLTGINLLILIHIFSGGVGIYLLMKRLGIGSGPAIVVGLFFTALPKVYAHYGAGHLSLLTAFCLTPWLCYASFGKSKSNWIAQSLLIAAITFADIRWLPFGLICWFACLIIRRNQNAEEKIRSLTLSAIGWLVCGLLISIGFLVALTEFTQTSTRSLMSIADVSALSFPLNRLLTIIFPSFGVTPEWMVYLGMGIPLLALIGAISGNHKVAFIWGILAFGCILISLGSQVPGFNYLANLPGFDLLRVPSRALFVAIFSILILAGYGIDSLIATDKKQTWILWLTGFLLISSGRVTWLAFQSKSSGVQLWIIPIIGLFSLFVFIALKQAGKISSNFLIFCTALFLLMDLGIISRFSFTEGNKKESFPVEILSGIPKYPAGRVYSPDYAIGQSIGMENGIAFAHGVHPLQISRYVDYLSLASGVPLMGYSVVQPPLKTGDPTKDNVDAIPNVQYLARLNVSHVIARNAIHVEKLINTYHDSNYWVYENSEYQSYPKMLNPENNLKLLRFTPNLLEYKVTGPGVLSTSDLSYPGWRAEIDGKFQQIEVSEGVFRAVQIPEGEHLLRFYYHPTYSFFGICLGFIVVLILTSAVINKTDD